MSYPPQGDPSAAVNPEGTEAGTVTSGDAALVIMRSLEDGETLEVTEASLELADGQPAPTDLDLVIASLDGTGSGTQQTTVLSGDGGTDLVDQTGSPLASYTNNSGGTQLVGVYVDNGNFGAGTGSNQDTLARAVTTIS